MVDITHTNACCFTGHRPEKLNMSEYEVKCKLEEAIRQTIRDGYTIFISGMACGVDLWAAEIVLRLKNEGYPINLVCAIPFHGFEKRWEQEQIKEYDAILNQAQKIEYICSHFSKYSFQLRNKWMVDNSSRIITVYNGSTGGTRNTLKYAGTQEKEIIILN